MQRPKNYNGSAVTNHAYGTQVTGSAVTNRAYDGRGRRGWKPRLWNAGYRQTQVEPAPTTAGADAVGNRAYGTRVTGRRGL